MFTNQQFTDNGIMYYFWVFDIFKATHNKAVEFMSITALLFPSGRRKDEIMFMFLTCIETIISGPQKPPRVPKQQACVLDLSTTEAPPN